MISLLYIATTKRKHKGNGIQVIHLSAQKRQENKTLHCTNEEIKDVISLSCEGTAVALGASSIKSLHLQSKTKIKVIGTQDTIQIVSDKRMPTDAITLKE